MFEINIRRNFLTFKGGLAGLAGQFPPEYMGSLVQGQAVGGIVTAIINIISIEGSTNPSQSAFYCFLVAAVFIAFDTVAFVAMVKTSYYKVFLYDIAFQTYVNN